MLKQIPNLITSLNLLCGCMAVFFAISGDLVTASYFVFSGIFFDFFDGLAARLLHAQSEVGLQLDSLADMVTSGVAPAVVMVQLLSESLTGAPVSIADTFAIEGWNTGYHQYLPFTGLLIAVGAAYRLAKFNVDTRQTTSFIGLPTPANALLVLSLPLILAFHPSALMESLILNSWFLIGIILMGCVLMNAELPLFALKFKSWDLKNNTVRYLFLLISVVAVVLLKFIAIPIILLIYVLLSLIWREN
ncbi:phosphatidylserine synthase [Rasiella rasia]|uniref:Phosphatidylserine synthase n=1 Tax=Rasiella rasia TaxID=2744027 RepID=A0A6G6GQ13_9FLAO|nr:CDP-alcohol phosphatidyltransferase family protein [Rasiella rasia]QIE60642.1 phosphatidylserine synthase [Rasiella rasia]